MTSRQNVVQVLACDDEHDKMLWTSKEGDRLAFVRNNVTVVILSRITAQVI